MTRPIEPGCIAVIVGSNSVPSQNGKVVTVGKRYIDDGGYFSDQQPRWHVDSDWIRRVTKRMGTKYAVCRENRLQRIDDGSLSVEDMAHNPYERVHT